MKEIVTFLIMILLSLNSFNVYGIGFSNDDENVRISLPRLVNYKEIQTSCKAPKVEIIQKNEIYSNEYISVTIYKPEIHVINNENSENAINAKINKIIDNFKNRIVEDSYKDNEDYKVNGLPIKQYVVNVNNSIYYNKDNILSLTLHLYNYTGGAHGSTTDISLNMDTTTGNNGTLKDFLGNNRGYDDIILNEIKNQVNQNPEMYFKESIDKLTKLPYNQKFFLKDDAVVVYFDEYEIAPYVAGRPQFSIPLNRFPNGLNKVKITEESPTITRNYFEFEDKKLSYNQYICLPQLECYNLSDKGQKLNDSLKASILKDISILKEEVKVKGITSYFTAFFYDENSIIISVTYIVHGQGEAYLESVTKKYVVDLCKNEIKGQ